MLLMCVLSEEWAEDFESIDPKANGMMQLKCNRYHAASDRRQTRHWLSSTPQLMFQVRHPGFNSIHDKIHSGQPEGYEIIVGVILVSETFQ
jgi:hypothetical protein